ncbi:response regulator transcription factor [Variovorax sp. RT4R15]|uniref:response regulator transcription factor n=1 Tax=Variovorax sp. RT4R15 TaxID=3443737 RepID=UPI003F456521
MHAIGLHRAPIGDLFRPSLEALRLMAPVLNDLFLAHFANAHQQPPATFETLTPRQKAIVRHLATGIDDKTIARALGLAEKTVRNQLADIYARLGVHKRTQLIALFK